MVIMSQQIQTINEKLEVIFKKKKSKRDLNGMEIVKMKSIIKKLKFYYKAHQKIWSGKISNLKIPQWRLYSNFMRKKNK